MSKKKNPNAPLMVIMTILAAAIIGCLVGAMLFIPSSDDSKEEKAQGVVGRISDNWDDQVSEDPDASQESGTTSN